MNLVFSGLVLFKIKNKFSCYAKALRSTADIFGRKWEVYLHRRYVCQSECKKLIIYGFELN